MPRPALEVADNSCRNRHCPKCQWRAAEAWLAAREAELLPVPYFPATLGAIAYQNKAKVYGLLFTAAAEALTTIAADAKHLGTDIGVTAVLHTWGQNLDPLGVGHVLHEEGAHPEVLLDRHVGKYRLVLQDVGDPSRPQLLVRRQPRH